MDKNKKENAIRLVIIIVIVFGMILGMLYFFTHNKSYKNEAIYRKMTEPYVVNTFEETPQELVEEYFDNSKVVTLAEYYEMSDGTWKMGDDITFDQAWKAGGLSSNTRDYFKTEDAVIVGIG